MLRQSDGQRPTGLFDEADNKFKKDKKYREDAEVTDEVWFFFDVETADAGLWDARDENHQAASLAAKKARDQGPAFDDDRLH